MVVEAEGVAVHHYGGGRAAGSSALADLARCPSVVYMNSATALADHWSVFEYLPLVVAYDVADVH